jgi:transposase
MDNVAVFVGLDYHEEFVQVCVLDAQGQQLGNRECANDWQVIVSYVERFGTRVQAAIESCAGAANLCDELMTRAGWLIDMAHPGFVSRMKQNPDKTDYQDAHVLADLERVGYLPRVWLAPQAVRDLRQLVRYRQQLTQQRRSTKLRIRAILREQRCPAPPELNAWTRAWKSWLQKEAELSVQSRWVLDKHVQELDRLAKAIEEVEQR